MIARRGLWSAERGVTVRRNPVPASLAVGGRAHGVAGAGCR